MALKAEEVLAIANKYTEDTVIGMGAIKGDKGDKGEKGDKGDNGRDGLKGDKGDTGNTGAQGEAGRSATVRVGSVTSGESPSVTNSGTSTDAVFNFVLAKGDKGDKGDKGNDGRDGQDGKSFEIKARFATEEELIEAYPHGPENTGDAYFVGTTANPDLYIWVTADEEWLNNGPIAGVKGDKGDTGDTGADGFSPVANVTKVGKVATVTVRDKIGTTTENINDGEDGNDGKSAYEVAVDEGFVGTEAEWIASLKGETGDGIYAVTVSQVEGASHLMVKFTSDTSTWVDCGTIASDVPIATTGVAGKVKPDGTSITIDEYGTISGASTLTAGAGINIVGDTISADTPIFTGTQSEWNALSTAVKKTYGQVNITDDESGTPEYYSTTETKTNKVWIDGKPIYRKVLVLDPPPQNWQATDLSSYFPNADEVFKGDLCRVTRSNGEIICQDEFWYQAADHQSILIAQNLGYDVAILVAHNTPLAKIEIAIEYTKTTD